MEKHRTYRLFVVWIVTSMGAISAAGLQQGNATIRPKYAGFNYEFDIRNDLIRQRHLLQAETISSTTLAYPQEKDLLTKINEFYADKNNMAMFCVLPVMIIIYGGCSAIYCAAKCRRYIRKRHTRSSNHHDDKTHLNSEDVSNSEFIDIPPSETGSPRTLGSPPAPTGPTPLPWYTPADPMVPPLSSLPPKFTRGHNHRQTNHGDDRHRTYKDILQIKKPMCGTSGYKDEPQGHICDMYGMAFPEHSNDGRDSVVSYKDELLARFDALSTFTMAKKAANILRTGTNSTNKEPDLFNGKPKQKMIFIAE
ncbi:uncharacterized protein [Haliotis asinina]|uniref:uncharacterized protein n=1 Tax=Haliotis asinina TaxID=109174 RepID=UPI0035327C4C